MLSRVGCVQLYNPMDCITPGSSVHGILQARILEWVSWIFLTQGSNPHLLGLLHCKQSLSSRGTWKPPEWESVSDSVVSDSLRSHGL